MNVLRATCLLLFLILITSFSVIAQPKSLKELPEEIRNYVEKIFPGFSLSDSLLPWPYLDELNDNLLRTENQSSYYLEADFNGDGIQDYVMHLFKIYDLPEASSYDKGRDLRAVIIYSNGNEYSHQTDRLHYSNSAYKGENISTYQLALVHPDKYEIIISEGRRDTINIELLSIGLIGSDGSGIVTWDDSVFVNHTTVIRY